MKSTKVYLVIDDGSKFVSNKDRYQIFTDQTVALAHAAKCGYANPMGFNDTVGVSNCYMCGPVNVTILPLEINVTKSTTKSKSGKTAKV